MNAHKNALQIKVMQLVAVPAAEPPRYEQGCAARHSLLDLVGHLSLLGTQGNSGILCGHIVAYNAGHELCTNFVRQIAISQHRGLLEAVPWLLTQDERRMMLAAAVQYSQLHQKREASHEYLCAAAGTDAYAYTAAAAARRMRCSPVYNGFRQPIVNANESEAAQLKQDAKEFLNMQEWQVFKRRDTRRSEAEQMASDYLESDRVIADRMRHAEERHLREFANDVSEPDSNDTEGSRAGGGDGGSGGRRGGRVGFNQDPEVSASQSESQRSESQQQQSRQRGKAQGGRRSQRRSASRRKPSS